MSNENVVNMVDNLTNLLMQVQQQLHQPEAPPQLDINSQIPGLGLALNLFNIYLNIVLSIF